MTARRWGFGFVRSWHHVLAIEVTADSDTYGLEFLNGYGNTLAEHFASMMSEFCVLLTWSAKPRESTFEALRYQNMCTLRLLWPRPAPNVFQRLWPEDTFADPKSNCSRTLVHTVSALCWGTAPLRIIRPKGGGFGIWKVAWREGAWHFGFRGLLRVVYELLLKSLSWYHGYRVRTSSSGFCECMMQEHPPEQHCQQHSARNLYPARVQSYPHAEPLNSALQKSMVYI